MVDVDNAIVLTFKVQISDISEVLRITTRLTTGAIMLNTRASNKFRTNRDDNREPPFCSSLRHTKREEANDYLFFFLKQHHHSNLLCSQYS